jgi:hypothetical protein
VSSFRGTGGTCASDFPQYAYQCLNESSDLRCVWFPPINALPRRHLFPPIGAAPLLLTARQRLSTARRAFPARHWCPRTLRAKLRDQLYRIIAVSAPSRQNCCPAGQLHPAHRVQESVRATVVSAPSAGRRPRPRPPVELVETPQRACVSRPSRRSSLSRPRNVRVCRAHLAGRACRDPVTCVCVAHPAGRARRDPRSRRSGSATRLLHTPLRPKPLHPHGCGHPSRRMPP